MYVTMRKNSSVSKELRSPILRVIDALGKVDAFRRELFGDVVVAQTKWALLSGLYAGLLRGEEMDMLSTTGASGAPYASARRNLDELIEDRLVRVRFFPGTRRRKHVELTPRGVAKVRTTLKKIERQLVSRAPRGSRT